MGKWLDRLKNYENPRKKHCQNRQKVEIRTFDSFVSAYSGDLQKKTAIELENFAECVAERSAIMQECAGLSEQEAEEQANVICMNEWKRYRQ